MSKIRIPTDGTFPDEPTSGDPSDAAARVLAAGGGPRPGIAQPIGTPKTPAQVFDTWSPAAGGPGIPDVVVDNPRASPALPLLPPNAPHWLIFDPHRWAVLDDGEESYFVPQLAKLVATPGCNGVDRVGDRFESKPDMRTAFANVAESGRFVVPLEVDGPGTSYLRSFLVGLTRHAKTGAVIELHHWLSRWETPYPGSDVVDTDHRGYATWLRDKAIGGYFSAPSKAVLDRAEALALGRLERRRNQYSDDPSKPAEHRHSLVHRFERELAAVRAERARVVSLVRGSAPAAPAGSVPDVAGV